MALNLHTIRSPCVVWKTKLPFMDKIFVSPVFSHPRQWQGQFVLKGHWRSYNGIEEWYMGTRTSANVKDKFGISIYLIQGNGGLGLIFSGKIDSPTENFSTMDSKQLLDCGFTGGEISLIFVFECENGPDILKEKPKINVKERLSKSIQTLHLQTSKSVQTMCLQTSKPIQTSCLQSFSKDIEKFFDNAEQSDVVLKCDERSFSVNKCILSARSDVFAAMFRNKMSENETGVIAVEDIQPAIMEQFLRYVYSGRVDSLCMDSVFDLYKAGDKYAVPSLKRKCASFLVDNLSEDNVCEVLLLAHTFGDLELLNTVASFAADRTEFLKSEDWNLFSKEYTAPAVEVFTKFFAK